MILALTGHVVIFAQSNVVPYWKSVQQFLLVVFTFSLLLLLQRLIVQAIAINFHKVAYNERIEESKFCTKAIDTLKKSFKMDIFNTDENGLARSKSLNKKKITFSQELQTPKIKATVEMELPSDFTAFGADAQSSPDKLSQSPLVPEKALESPIADNNEGKDDVDSTHTSILENQKGSLSIGRFDDLKSLKILSDKNAIHLARRLFACLSTSSNTIPIEAFYKLFPDEKTACSAFEIFHGEASGELTYSELKGSILRIYKEKRDLLKSLRDLSQALGQLNRILYGFVVAMTAICMLPIYGIPVEAVLPFTSLIIAWSFIFGGSAKSTFECIIFLFINHPFDTGDKIIVNEKAYFVDELNLLTTVLRRGDGQKMYMSNARLAELPIINIRRSGNQVILNLSSQRKQFSSYPTQPPRNKSKNYTNDWIISSRKIPKTMEKMHMCL
jgi:hypothetical protein